MTTMKYSISAAFSTCLVLMYVSPINAFQPLFTTIHQKPKAAPAISLQMGLFDFFKTRQDDFIKLEESQDIYGPGDSPLILLYNIPHEISDDELRDMVEDGAPIANQSKNGVVLKRVHLRDLDDGGVYNDATVSEVLNMALTVTSPSKENKDSAASTSFVDPDLIPILYFSRISNSEMMQTYNIIAREIYEETGGRAKAACAKVVEPALGKSFKRLIMEISGDHDEAMKGLVQEGGSVDVEEG